MATFRCEACGAEEASMVERGAVSQPGKCPSAQCGRKATMRLVPNRCAYVNRQVRARAC
jgi:DNA replicative helicase MCM subunit Mcm2 (Cdc46/Mcm family)